MDRITSVPSPRNRFSTDGEDPITRALGKLRCQTVLISKCLGKKEAHSPQKILESLRGTGILVRNWDGPGILTAGHVVRDLICKESSMRQVAMAVDQSLNPTRIGSHGHWRAQIQGCIVRGVGTRKSHHDSPEKQLNDPDIVWLRITEKDARKLGPDGYPGCIFHNWQQSEKTRDKEVQKQRRQETRLWVCGRTHEKSTKLLKEENEFSICAMTSQVRRESPVTEPSDGWDRFDYTLWADDQSATRNSDREICKAPSRREEILSERPASWSGISGAGIWDVRHPEGQTSKDLNCSLVGVVYAEHNVLSDEPQKLRGHGIGSINRVLGRT